MINYVDVDDLKLGDKHVVNIKYCKCCYEEFATVGNLCQGCFDATLDDNLLTLDELIMEIERKNK